METSLIRILPACLTQPLPRGWDISNDEFVLEVMPAVDHPSAIVLSLATTEPDILLLDADCVEGDVFAATIQALAARKELAVVMISSDNSPERLHRAMLSGAEEYLIKPIEAQSLHQSLISIAEHRTLRVISRDDYNEIEHNEVVGGLVVGVMAGKGGLGKTTLAINLASVVASAPGKSAGLLALESGDGAVLLNLQPKLGLMDVASGENEKREAGGYSIEWLRQFSTIHPKTEVNYWQWQGAGTQAPDELPDDFFSLLFNTCRRAQAVTFVDFPLLTSEEASAVLPLLDVILVVSSSSDLLALRATKTFLAQIPEELMPRVRLIVNRADDSDMISRADFESALDTSVAAVLPNEPSVAAQSINMGSPFVVTQNTSELAATVKQLAQVLFRLPAPSENAKPKKRFMLF